MPFIDFSKVKKSSMYSPPGDLFFRLECLVAMHHTQPHRIVMNFGSAVLEVIFNNKNKAVNEVSNAFIQQLMSGNPNIEEFLPEIDHIAFEHNHMYKS